MSTFSSAMMALAGPMAKKVLASLGIGLITYVGVDAAVTAALNAAKSNFGGLTADIVQIAALFGVFTALSIVAGGLIAGVTMIALERFGKIV